MPDNRKPYTPPTAEIIRMTDAEAIRILSRERECVQQHLDVAADGGGYVSPDGMIRALDYVEACAVAIAALHEKHLNPLTNADRIRAMTNEELAELLCSADWCEHCDYLRGDGTCEVMETMLADDGPLHPYCVAACLNYLRQPAEEAQCDE